MLHAAAASFQTPSEVEWAGGSQKTGLLNRFVEFLREPGVRRTHEEQEAEDSGDGDEDDGDGSHRAGQHAGLEFLEETAGLVPAGAEPPDVAEQAAAVHGLFHRNGRVRDGGGEHRQDAAARQAISG